MPCNYSMYCRVYKMQKCDEAVHFILLDPTLFSLKEYLNLNDLSLHFYFYSPELAPWPLCFGKRPAASEGTWSHRNYPPLWRSERRRVRRRSWSKLLKMREDWRSWQSLMRQERGWATPWRSDILALMRRGAEAGRRREGCPATHCMTTEGEEEQVIGENQPRWAIKEKHVEYYILCIYKHLYWLSFDMSVM